MTQQKPIVQNQSFEVLTMPIYTISLKDRNVTFKAKNRDYAFAKLFKDVADDKIRISELGNIVMLHAHKDDYPFRTVPLLWQMKLIDGDTAVANIMEVTGVSKKEAELLLTKYSYEDSRLIPFIEELRRKESR